MVQLLRRKAVTRAARRSPLTANLLRAPGHSLREKLEDLRSDVGFDVAVLMVVPNLLLALYLLQLQFQRQPPSMWVNGMFAALCVGLIGYSIRTMLRKSGDMDKLRKGLDAEVAVGQELDQLMRQGAVVFHDLQADKFNIDHVVIAPQGVFCVETKGYTKALAEDGSAAARVGFRWADAELSRLADIEAARAGRTQCAMARQVAEQRDGNRHVGDSGRRAARLVRRTQGTRRRARLQRP